MPSAANKMLLKELLSCVLLLVQLGVGQLKVGEEPINRPNNGK